ncbi:hypothetical protein ACISJZ_08710 [Campylobacter coli]
MDFGLCVFVDKMFIFRVSPAIFLTKKACGAMLTLIKGKFRFSLGCKVLGTVFDTHLTLPAAQTVVKKFFI